MKKSCFIKCIAMLLIVSLLQMITPVAFSGSFYAEKSFEEKMEIINLTINNVKKSANKNETFKSSMEQLIFQLKIFYPNEFHEGLDKLDNINCLQGGLTERQKAMSDIEYTLDIIEKAKTIAERESFLDSLQNDIFEVEIQKAEALKEEFDALLKKLEEEKIGSHNFNLAINRIENILNDLYPEFSQNCSNSEKLEIVRIQNVFSTLKQQNVNDVDKDSIILNIKVSTEELIANDDRFMSNRDLTSTLINVPKIMQVNSNTCSAATIAQTLTHINGSFNNSQISVYNYLTNNGGTGLNNVLNYINGYLSNNFYGRKTFNGSSSFFRWTLRAYTYNRPIVYSFSNDDLNFWPFTTNGHFNNCAGYFNFTDSTTFYTAYFFCDPFYYISYGNSYGFTIDDPINEGEIITNYDCIRYVSTHLHGAGNMSLGAY